MKKVLLIAIAALGISTANAQEKKQERVKLTPEQRTEKKVAKLTEVASLSADQQVKVKSILLEKEKQREIDRKQMDASKEKAKANHKAYNEKLKAVLIPEQMEKIAAHRKQMREQHKGKKTQHIHKS